MHICHTYILHETNDKHTKFKLCTMTKTYLFKQTCEGTEPLNCTLQHITYNLKTQTIQKTNLLVSTTKKSWRDNNTKDSNFWDHGNQGPKAKI